MSDANGLKHNHDHDKIIKKESDTISTTGIYPSERKSAIYIYHINTDTSSNASLYNTSTSPNLLHCKSGTILIMSPATPQFRSQFLHLPAELIPLITAHLEYPDILSLRLTHPHFYHSPLLSTNNDAGIRSRVAWLCSTGSFGPLEVLLLPPRKSSKLTLALSELWTRNIAVWMLIDPLRLSWRTDDISRVCMRLKTSEEFLSNRQVQQMLRLRRRHAACVAGGGACRVVPGMVCEGPKDRCTRLVYTSGVVESVKKMVLNLVYAMQGWSRKSGLSGWDVLFLILISVALVMPWSLLL